jgi:hypothetical protein
VVKIQQNAFPGFKKIAQPGSIGELEVGSAAADQLMVTA